MSRLKAHVDKGVIQRPKREATRDGFGEALLELGKRNKKVIVLTADLAESTRTRWFCKRHPQRFVECGVAEQNMIGVAAGLALAGKMPFACSFGVFVPGRCWDHIRVQVAYNNVSVKIVATHTGLSTGEDGATHQALEDIAMLRALPNMTIVAPCDAIETQKATRALAAQKGPAYLRLGRAKLPVVTTQKSPFKIGRAEILRDGNDVALVACGAMVHQAILAAEKLARHGIQAMVVNNHTIKPIDQKALVRAAKRTGAVVTIEEHQICGGLGSAVLEALAGRIAVPIEMVGVRDVFGESGTPAQLWEKFGLSVADIVHAARVAISKRLSGQCVMSHADEVMVPSSLYPATRSLFPCSVPPRSRFKDKKSPR